MDYNESHSTCWAGAPPACLHDALSALVREHCTLEGGALHDVWGCSRPVESGALQYLSAFIVLASGEVDHAKARERLAALEEAAIHLGPPAPFLLPPEELHRQALAFQRSV